MNITRRAALSGTAAAAVVAAAAIPVAVLATAHTPDARLAVLAQ